jgi:hypothetical protein
MKSRTGSLYYKLPRKFHFGPYQSTITASYDETQSELHHFSQEQLTAQKNGT